MQALAATDVDLDGRVDRMEDEVYSVDVRGESARACSSWCF